MSNIESTSAPFSIAIGRNNRALHENAVVIGSGGTSSEPGEIAFFAEGKAVLQFFPDGRILVHGRPGARDEQLVRDFRGWLRENSVKAL